MFSKANCARSREFPPVKFSNCKEKLDITKKERIFSVIKILFRLSDLSYSVQ